MPSTASSAQGTTLEVQAAGSPTTWLPVGNFTTWSGPSGEAAEIDVTNLSSTRKEYLIGLADEGNYTFNLHYDPDDAGQARMKALRASGGVGRFRLTHPTSAVEEFNGFVKSFPRDGGVDSAIAAAVNIRVTGEVEES